MARVGSSNREPHIRSARVERDEAFDNRLEPLVSAEMPERKNLARLAVRRLRGQLDQRSDWYIQDMPRRVAIAQQAYVFGTQHADRVGTADKRRGDVSAGEVPRPCPKADTFQFGHAEHV